MKVKLFANFREIAGRKEIEIDAKDVNELLEKLAVLYPEFKKLYGYAIIMVNGNVVKGNVKLKKGDVVALLPPLSGGYGDCGLKKKEMFKYHPFLKFERA